MSYARFHVAEQDEALKKNKAAQLPAPQYTESASEAEPAGLKPNQSQVLRLQRTLGNQAVVRRLVAQREDDEQDDDNSSSSDNDNSNDSSQAAATNSSSSSADPTGDSDAPDTNSGDSTLDADYPVTVEGGAPITISLAPASGLGDFPMPDPNTAMAKRDERLLQGSPVQRDDDDNRRRLGLDVSTGWTFPLSLPPGASQPAPWSLQGTALWRNFNVGQLSGRHFSLDVLHEPGISLGIDSSGGLASQEAMTLLNLHWAQPWNRELEIGLSAIANQTLLPHFAHAYGGQVQAEQHILPWFSLTFSVTGMWTPPQAGQPGQFVMTAGPNALFHFNAL